MNWNPDVAIVIYQPVDFYSVVVKETEKCLDDARQECEQAKIKLKQCNPNSTYRSLFYPISDTTSDAMKQSVKTILDIQKNVRDLAATVSVVTRGFEKELKVKIEVLNSQIKRIIGACIIYLEQYHYFLKELSLAKT